MILPYNILSCNIYRYRISREKRLRVEPLDEIHELHHQSHGSPSIVQGAIMDIQKRVAVSVIQRIHFTLPRLLCAHLSPRRSLSFSRASSTSSPPPSFARSPLERIDLRLFFRKPYIFRFTVRGAVECPASIQTRVHLRSSRQV